MNQNQARFNTWIILRLQKNGVIKKVLTFIRYGNYIFSNHDFTTSEIRY